MKFASILILGAAALVAALPKESPQSECGRIAGKCYKKCGGWKVSACFKTCKEDTLAKEPELCKNYYFGPPHRAAAPDVDTAVEGAMSLAARHDKDSHGGEIEFDFEEFANGIASAVVMAKGPVDCDECKRRYHNCVGFAFVPGLKACEKVCRLRVEDTDEVCKSCPNSYPNYFLALPPIPHPRPGN